MGIPLLPKKDTSSISSPTNKGMSVPLLPKNKADFLGAPVKQTKPIFSPVEERTNKSKELINGMLKSGQATTAPILSIPPREKIEPPKNIDKALYENEIKRGKTPAQIIDEYSYPSTAKIAGGFIKDVAKGVGGLIKSEVSGAFKGITKEENKKELAKKFAKEFASNAFNTLWFIPKYGGRAITSSFLTPTKEVTEQITDKKIKETTLKPAPVKIFGKEFYPLGKEEIKPINEIIDKYTKWAGESGGFDINDPKTKMMGGILAVGELILDADLGAGKAKNLLQQTVKNIEKQTGEKLLEKSVKNLATKIDEITKIVDKTKRQEVLSKVVGDFIIEEKSKTKDLVMPTKKISKTTGPLIQEAEIKRVSDNLLKNNPGITRIDAEAMAKDVIKNRKFNKVKTTLVQEATKYAEAGENKYYYVRNVENKGGYIKGKPSMEGTGRFNQQYEPTGEYMNIVSKRGYDSALPNLKKGITEFKKPLVIETDLSPNWKKELSDKYGGLKRDELSKAIKNDGYDGIITMTKSGSGKLYPSEVVDLKVIKFNKANKADNILKTEIKPEAKQKIKLLTGKDQLALREQQKLARETEKLKREGLMFYNELEDQYQSFKKLITPSKLDEIEDVAMLKKKIKAKPEEIDNILYSQEKSVDEVFDMFKDRRYKEAGALPQVMKETKAIVAEKARQQVKSAKEILDRRKGFIRAVQKQFGLSDNDLKKITKKDIRLMKDYEYKNHLDNIRYKAAELADTRQAKNELMTTIREGEFKKVDNLRKAMELPQIKDMTMKQLRQFDKALQPFEKGDTFLTVRDLELVNRTKLKGIKTLREAREALAKEMGVPIEKIEAVKYDWSDLGRYDTALAEKNPFYQIMVERAQGSVLKSDASFLRVEKESDRLARAAEKSRQIGLKEKLYNLVAPQDKGIVDYLQAPINEKSLFAEKLTKEQLNWAHYIERYFNDAYDYLVSIKNLQGSRFEDMYYPHMRMGFWENVRENGVLQAFKKFKEAEEADRVTFSIIDDTGDIMNKEKFFANTLYRTGQLDPSKNVSKTFKRYVKALEKKKALDEIIDEIDIYAQSLTPENLTPKGLEIDRRLKKFVKQYINNKKGRKYSFGGVVEQNGKIDMGLRAGNSFVAVLDLGGNIFSNIAATIGEQVMTYQALGKIKYLKAWKRRLYDTGLKRLADKNAVKILTENKEFIGKNIWSELAEAGEGISEKFTKSLFGLFHQSSVEANKIFLLGSISEAEMKSGKLSAERLAKLKLEAGRWRDMGRDMKSVLGSTSIGGTATKYKTWAIPILRTTYKDLVDLGKIIKKEDFKTVIKSREFQELYRALEMSVVLLAVGSYVMSEEKDDTFIGKLKNRAYIEAMTFLGGVDPTMFLSTPRIYSFTQKLAENLKSIIKLEEYQKNTQWGRKGELKGVEGLKRQFTPSILRNFKNEKSKEKKTEFGLPKLPKIGSDLPPLPKIGL